MSEGSLQPTTATTTSNLMPPKRKAEKIEDAVEVLSRMEEGGIAPPTSFTGWNPEEIAIYIAEVANINNVTDRAFKKARAGLPSFSTASWTDFATEWHFPLRVKFLNLESFIVPACFLPPSFHKRTYEAAWAAQDVYQEPGEQETEAARLKNLEPVGNMYHVEGSLPDTLHSVSPRLAGPVPRPNM